MCKIFAFIGVHFLFITGTRTNTHIHIHTQIQIQTLLQTQVAPHPTRLIGLKIESTVAQKFPGTVNMDQDGEKKLSASRKEKKERKKSHTLNLNTSNRQPNMYYFARHNYIITITCKKQLLFPACVVHSCSVSRVKFLDVCVLLCFINPRVRKIRNEASSCPEISPELSAFTMSLAPPVQSLPIFLTDTEKLYY